VFLIEVITTTGRVSERFATYEEARRRVEQFPPESVVGIPFIFAELADGSQRLVREDGKPLQWHRHEETKAVGPDEPLPLADESSGLLGEGKWVLLERPTPQDDGLDDEPLRVDGLPPADPPAAPPDS
jgi:hypothetical protein